MVADPLSTDDGTEKTSAKKNFVGKVTKSEVNTTDERFQTDNPEYESDVDMLYEIEPMTEYEKKMYVLGLNANDNFKSKWMVQIGHLQAIHGNLKEQGVTDRESLCEFVEGNVYEFREITWEEDEDFEYEGADYTVNFKDMFSGSENKPNPMLVPVREVTDADELADLGAGDSAGAGDVEEVEL